ncbi:MAG: HNH endonuclease, partial [Solirubrobacterales bacterium]
VRLHQRRFRKKVLRAYNEHCLICRLREPGLLDASHIVGDADAKGVASVSNGVALCAIHHRAFDGMLLTIDPDYKVRVSERLLEDEDGPMLEHGIKDFHGKKAMYLPRLKSNQPDRDALEERLARFK